MTNNVHTPAVAVIGAGMAGVTAASVLKDVADVTIFEKARGPGGRMSSRRAENEMRFDHGARYFTARDDAFKAYIAQAEKDGAATQWNPRALTPQEGKDPFLRDRFEPRYVATPAMNALCKREAEAVTLKTQTRITAIEKRGNDTFLQDENGAEYGPFAFVIIAAPAPQTADLLPADCPLTDRVRNVKMTGCFTLMAGFDAPPPAFNWDALEMPDAEMIQSVTLEHSKPGRAGAFALTAHTTNAWAETHMEDRLPDTETAIFAETCRLIGEDLPPPLYLALHRWRYADVENPLGEPCLTDSGNNLAVCGDWCIAGRVEAAFLSGKAAGEQALRALAVSKAA